MSSWVNEVARECLSDIVSESLSLRFDSESTYKLTSVSQRSCNCSFNKINELSLNVAGKCFSGLFIKINLEIKLQWF